MPLESAASATTLLLIAVAGGLGSMARFAVDGAVSRRFPGTPWGLWSVNVSGSLLLGFLTAAAAAAAPSADWPVVLGTGLLGGYTTFSSAMVEGVRVLRDAASEPTSRTLGRAALHTVGMLAAGLASAAVGVGLAGLLF